MLFIAAVMMSWLEGSLTSRFTQVCETLDTMSAHRRRCGRTFSGYSQAMLAHGAVLLAIIQARMMELIRQITIRGGAWETRGWVVFGVDGTRSAAPRTAANRRGLGGMGRDRANPQAWLTTLLHLTTGLPWAFATDRGDGSERRHLRDMLGLLPSSALLVADAGYVGYDLWRLLIDLNHSFLIRVGSNVNLIQGLARQEGLVSKVDEEQGLVWLWPRIGRMKQPPLLLRLIVLHDGRQPLYLVTNVLESDRLDDQAALEFYRMRWRLELWFRQMKQTLGLRKLQSQSPEQARLELSWAAVGLTLLGLMQVEALIDSGQSLGQASCVGALKVVRRAMRQPGRRPGAKTLSGSLREAVKDPYLRTGPKTIGRYPRKKKRTITGAPNRQEATLQDRLTYQEFIALQFSTAFTA